MYEQARAEPRPRRVFDLATIVLFCAAIGAPLVGGWLTRSHSEQGAAGEFRTPARRPPLRFDRNVLIRFPERYESYHADSFGLRDWYIRAHNVLKWFVFGVSPTDTVLLGQDDWVFAATDHSPEAFRGAIPYTDQDLAGWQRMLESRRDWCEEHGAEFLCVLIPSKEQLYPEFMPAGMERGRTRLDQLVDHLGQHSDIELIDLTESIRREKERDGSRDDTVFRRLGTHWTDRGAWAAYHALATRMAERHPGIEPWERDQFVLVEKPLDTWDLWGERLYMEDLLPTREFGLVPHGRALEAKIISNRKSPYQTVIYRVDDESLPTAVLFHDSNGQQIRRFLAECFSESQFCWTYHYFDTERIAKVAPDLVVMLVSERALVFLPPQPVGEEELQVVREKFQASEQVLLSLDTARNKPPLLVQDVARIRVGGSEAGDSIAIESRGARSKVLLPEFEFPEGENIVLRLELESPADTELILAYLTRADPAYDQHRTIMKPLRSGRNVVFIELLSSRLAGRLLLRPGTVAGDYVLRSLEVRAVPY